MKSIFTTIGLLFFSISYSQVGINTTSPNATLDVVSQPQNLSITDGIIPPKLTGEVLKSKDNLYQTNQTGAIVYITTPVVTSSPKTINVTAVGYYYFDGSVWQAMKNSTGANITAINGLTKTGDQIKLGGSLTEVTTLGTSATNMLRLTGLQEVNAFESSILIVDDTGNVKFTKSLANDLSIPNPAVFVLPTTMTNFLQSQGTGGSQNVNFVQQKNKIQGLTYNASTQTISFPIGTYQINFIYEATHNATGCAVSSYFVDFPIDGGSTARQRIHSTASHSTGSASSHGGTVSYTTTLTSPRTWVMSLGRGQSGNCLGAGMDLVGGSTQVLIFRIGD